MNRVRVIFRRRMPWRLLPRTMNVCALVALLLGLLPPPLVLGIAPASMAPMAEGAAEILDGLWPAPSVAYAAPEAAPDTVPLAALPGEIGGTVFRDYNANGAKGSTEPGVQGIIVSAYGAAGNIAATAVTNASGGYTLTGLTDSIEYRIEFSGLPSYLKPGVVGANSKTTVAFATSPSPNVDLAVHNPAQYCDSNPAIITSCYVSGDQQAVGTDGATQDVIVSFPYNASGPRPNANTYLATAGQMGSVWGMAYQQSTKKAFTSAVLKRHMGLGPLGTGGIYTVDYTNPSVPIVANYLNLNSLGINTGADPRTPYNAATMTPWNPVTNPNTVPPDRLDPQYDVASYDQIGKRGIGDIDISDDDASLWVMNLFNRELVQIDIASKALIGQYAVPTAACPNPADARPWAVKYYDDQVYIGLICSAQSTGNRANLRAHVYVLDANNTGAGFQPVINFSLGYTREIIVIGNAHPGAWRAWTNQWGTVSGTGFNAQVVSNPQPILSDIEIDNNGNLILGLLDRFAFQGGNRQRGINPPSTTLYHGVSGGDILRACKVGSGYVIEGSANCPYSTNGYNGEFYEDDHQFNGSTIEENTIGGLAYQYGREEVVVDVYDVFDYLEGGVFHLSNIDGSFLSGYVVFENASFDGASGKSAGLGDLELICASAPIEIGNRVWFDGNGNGIQDPGEAPIANIDVVLTDVNGTNFTTTTGANGEYYFNNSNVVGGLLPTSVYTLTIDLSQAAISLYELTTANANAGTTLPDGVDSDAVEQNGQAVIVMTTGAAGHNDHTLDFGLRPATPKLAIAKTLVSPASGAAVVSDSLIYNLTISNTGQITVSELNLSDTFDPNYAVFSSASIAPDSSGVGTLGWVGSNDGVNPGNGSLQSVLPLGPGQQFVITVTFIATKP